MRCCRRRSSSSLNTSSRRRVGRCKVFACIYSISESFIAKISVLISPRDTISTTGRLSRRILKSSRCGPKVLKPAATSRTWALRSSERYSLSMLTLGRYSKTNSWVRFAMRPYSPLSWSAIVLRKSARVTIRCCAGSASCTSKTKS